MNYSYAKSDSAMHSLNKIMLNEIVTCVIENKCVIVILEQGTPFILFLFIFKKS